MMHAIRKGFTLVELVIAMAIGTVLLVLIVSLYFSIENARAKQQGIAEVETQGTESMSVITQAIRNAKFITTPATTTSATSLSLTTYTASTTPTLFTLASSTLLVTEGTNTATPLTAPQVILTGLSFQNLSPAGTSGSVKVQFTLSYASTTSQYKTSYSKTFYGSATVRRLQQ